MLCCKIENHDYANLKVHCRNVCYEIKELDPTTISEQELLSISCKIENIQKCSTSKSLTRQEQQKLGAKIREFKSIFQQVKNEANMSTGDRSFQKNHRVSDIDVKNGAKRTYDGPQERTEEAGTKSASFDETMNTNLNVDYCNKTNDREYWQKPMKERFFPSEKYNSLSTNDHKKRLDQPFGATRHRNFNPGSSIDSRNKREDETKHYRHPGNHLPREGFPKVHQYSVPLSQLGKSSAAVGSKSVSPRSLESFPQHSEYSQMSEDRSVDRRPMTREANIRRSTPSNLDSCSYNEKYPNTNNKYAVSSEGKCLVDGRGRAKYPTNRTSNNGREQGKLLLDVQQRPTDRTYRERQSNYNTQQYASGDIKGGTRLHLPNNHSNARNQHNTSTGTKEENYTNEGQYQNFEIQQCIVCETSTNRQEATHWQIEALPITTVEKHSDKLRDRYEHYSEENCGFDGRKDTPNISSGSRKEHSAAHNNASGDIKDGTTLHLTIDHSHEGRTEKYSTNGRREQDFQSKQQDENETSNYRRDETLQQNKAPVVEIPCDEVSEEALEEPLKILDVHEYFQDHFDLNSLDTLGDPLKQINKIEKWARTFESDVNNFSEEMYSLKYFVLDEKLMRLIERLDKFKCQDDEAATNKKVEVIEFIKDLHSRLDSNATKEY